MGRQLALTTGLSPTSYAAPQRITAAACFTLFVLILANLFNMLDRQIVSILAQAIKADLHLDDADLGFLLGTAFAVFYSIVGIAMGRISDFISRKRMLAFGLALWSVMTALGGASTSFLTLSAARIGVGVGEAVANPCSHSMLSDAFPQRNRSLALGTYLAGTFLGGTFAMFLGGYFLQHWKDLCISMPIAGACHLAGWKAALIAAGLPGIPLALLALAIREPARLRQSEHGVLRIIACEISAALPPFTLFIIHRLAGRAGVMRNLALTAAIVVIAAALILLTGDIAQWVAFGLGAYAVVTWGQVQSYGDHPLFRLTFGDPTFTQSTITVAIMACIVGVPSVWAAPLAMRTFKVPPAQIGLGLGIVMTVGAVIGVIAGGWLTDRWKKTDPRAPMLTTGITLAGIIPSVALMAFAPTIGWFFVGVFFQSMSAALWSGGIAAMIQDLVIPRMRGAAAASQSLVAIVIASGLGPYWTGKVSAMTGSLRIGLFSILVLVPFAIIMLRKTARRLQHETPAGRMALAIAAGEPAA
jgi:MFS family permease